jgi:hypothetical protein
MALLLGRSVIRNKTQLQSGNKTNKDDLSHYNNNLFSHATAQADNRQFLNTEAKVRSQTSLRGEQNGTVTSFPCQSHSTVFSAHSSMYHIRCIN